MTEQPNSNRLKGIFEDAKDVAEKVATKTTDGVGEVYKKIGAQLGEVKAQRERRAEKKESTKEPDPYALAILKYNDAYTRLNDTGMQLFGQRERSMDQLDLIESLVNSIARTPKSFDADFAEIQTKKQEFRSHTEFAEKELATARKNATGAGIGVAMGAGIATLAPTGALWVATTFGTASTGAAISSLSGAAATKAAVAWLGGGAVAAGGGGISSGTALLALAGPVGWTLAGATILTTVVIATTSMLKNKSKKEKAISEVKENTASTERATARLEDLLQRTTDLRKRLITSYESALPYFGDDYADLGKDERGRITTLVNNAKACAALLNERFDDGKTPALAEDLADD